MVQSGGESRVGEEKGGGRKDFGLGFEVFGFEIQMSLARQILAGEIRALAKGITLVESERKCDAKQAAELLDTVRVMASARITTARRIGISGGPGVRGQTY